MKIANDRTPNFRFKDTAKGKLINEMAPYHTNDNILHIHIPKCAGTWLKDIIYNCQNGMHRFNFSHRAANPIKTELEEDGYNYSDFNSFAVVRNPWERLWSSYLYSRYGTEITNLDALENFENKQSDPIYSNPYIYGNQLGKESQMAVHESVKEGFVRNDFNATNFSDYVDKIHDLFIRQANFYDYIYLQPQFIFVVDDNKNVMVDKIFKTTEMDKLFKWVYSINKDSMIYLRAKYKPKKNVSIIKAHYYNVYDEKTINKVAEIYKDDIEIFNFKFED